MEKIQQGKYVEMVYDLYKVKADGTEKLVHQSDEADPERFVYGVTPGMIIPLEKAIFSLAAGDKFNLTVKADEAFGPYDPNQVAELSRDLFLVDGKFDSEYIKKGAIVPMMTADGFRINGVVLEVTDEIVKMDFNHPLANDDVRFDGKILTVRDATPEELNPSCGCGCGCGDHGCGDDCGGCGDDHGCGCGCH